MGKLMESPVYLLNVDRNYIARMSIADYNAMALGKMKAMEGDIISEDYDASEYGKILKEAGIDDKLIVSTIWGLFTQNRAGLTRVDDMVFGKTGKEFHDELERDMIFIKKLAEIKAEIKR